jgi:hypothetical protein
MTLKPGQSTTVAMSFMMHEGMDGPHDFRLHLVTNDPAHVSEEVKILSDWVK